MPEPFGVGAIGALVYTTIELGVSELTGRSLSERAFGYAERLYNRFFPSDAYLLHQFNLKLDTVVERYRESILQEAGRIACQKGHPERITSKEIKEAKKIVEKTKI